MDLGLTSSTGEPRPARLYILPPHVRQEIWKHFVPDERKIVQAARKKFPSDPRPDAAPEYTLKVREFKGTPKLPVILHICRESRALLPRLFQHATTDGKMQGIWWNTEVDVLYLDYDIVPCPELFLDRMPAPDRGLVQHLAVGLRLGADFVYRLELDKNLHTVSATPDACGDLATVLKYLKPETLAIAYPSLPKFWMPTGAQRMPLGIEASLRAAGAAALPLDPSYLRGDLRAASGTLVTVFDAACPETALEVLLTLKAAQDRLLLADRLFYALLEAFVEQKRREYLTVAARASERWGYRRIEDLVYELPSLRGANQVLYVTPMMRFDDGPPTAWIDALKGYLARLGQQVP